MFCHVGCVVSLVSLFMFMISFAVDEKEEIKQKRIKKREEDEKILAAASN